MVVTNDRYFGEREIECWHHRCCKRYSPEEITSIIDSGSLEQKIRLSRYFYNISGIYRQLVTHYATLLNYSGVLIPNPVAGRHLSNSRLQKKYEAAVEFTDTLKVSDLATSISLKALIEGSYYGLLIELEKNCFTILELPSKYCRNRLKDLQGRDVLEFNLSYFNSLKAKDLQVTLDAYPKFISKAYKEWKNGKRESGWILIPPEMGICFPFLDGTPLFLSSIPAIVRYEDGLDIEKERDLDETRKIIVQHIPHLDDGRFVLEPPEAEELHEGAVQMLRGNRNISVLTTYADVEAITSKTSSDQANTTIEKLLNNVYTTAGVSSQIFASTGSSTLQSSIKNDISLMMSFADKIASLISLIVNKVCGDKSLIFEYRFLPVSLHNEKEYVDSAFKMASSGYSFLLPAAAMGFSSRQLLNLKDLENNVLKLTEKLVPLSSSYTQSGTSSAPSADQNPVGAPKKEEEEKAEKTIQNETSLDNQTE